MRREKILCAFFMSTYKVENSTYEGDTKNSRNGIIFIEEAGGHYVEKKN